jgi:predicted lipoprotein
MKDTMTLTLRKLFGPTLAVLVISVIALSTTYVTGADVTLLEKGVKAKVDSAAFAEAYYEEQIVPYILENAQDLAEMDAAIIVDSNSAGAIYGNQDGPNAAYSVPTMFTAIAGELKGDLLVLEIEGVETKVYLQVGPALNGTAIRDVSGLVNFGMFDNQLAYQDVGTKLNDKVRDLVLSLVDKETLTGKTLNIVGAFSLFNPAQYMIVPVALEVVE